MAQPDRPVPLTALMVEAERLLDDAIALRRDLHRHPELGLHLPRTQSSILEALEGLPFSELRTGDALTSVVATLDGAHPGPTILLRADMDALPMDEESGLDFASAVPGAAHTCGHDSHAAMLVGAAKLLAAHRDVLAGRVMFMFQPGEEGHDGALRMIEEGLLDGPDPPTAAFAIHQFSLMASGTICVKDGPISASSDYVKIVVTGRGGHAAQPHSTIDPVPVACAIVTAIQTLVARTLDAFDPAIISITRIQAGSTDNAIPDTAEIGGTIRALTEKTRQRVWEGLQRIATGTADAHRATAEVTITPGRPPVVNDERWARHAADIARELVGDHRTTWLKQPIMGSEDFSYVLNRVPGVYVMLGARPSNVERPAPPHSSRMVMDETAMAPGIAMYAAMALTHTSA